MNSGGQLNDRHKVSCNLLRDDDVRTVEDEGRQFVLVNVPRASRLQRPVFIQTNSGMFVSTANLLTDSLAVQNQFTGLRDPKAEYEEAAPYVIALAQQKGGIVVTQKRQLPRRTDRAEPISFPTFAGNSAYRASACWA